MEILGKEAVNEDCWLGFWNTLVPLFWSRQEVIILSSSKDGFIGFSDLS